MKRTLPLCAVLSVLPTVALANPVALGPRHIGLAGIVATAFCMEIAITTGYLICLGMAAGPLAAALLFLNLATYLGVLLPGLGFGIPVMVMEVVVVCLEAAIIKGLSWFFPFQGVAYVYLKWRHAFIAAAIGNAFSYGIGLLLG